MVFFLLIVMVVFASFMILVNQNTGVENTAAQARQLDLDRFAEQETVSIANPEIATLTNRVYLTCTITDNGTLSAQLIRLWVEDVSNQAVGNLTLSPSIVLQPGTSLQYLNSVYVANMPAMSSDQFIFWFVTARGNVISAYPNDNEFNAIGSNGTFPGVNSVNSTYTGNQTPLQLSLATTQPNQLIYVVISYDDGNTLHTPTSTPILTWTKRGQTQTTANNGGYGNSGGDSILESFYSIDPLAGPITISISSTADELSDYYCSAMAFAIFNVNTTSPFDGSPQTSIGYSTMPQDTITTTYSNDLVIGALGIDNLNPVITPGAGFGQIMPVQSSYGASGQDNAMPRSVWSEWSLIATPTTNLPVNCSFSSIQNWASILDAVKLVVTPPTNPISLSPSSGPVGQPVTVTGQGYAANSKLIATYNNNPIPFNGTTDSSGNILPGATFNVPAGSAPGIQNVTIIDNSFNYALANFTLTTSSITVTPAVGPIGTSVNVNGLNFIDNSTISINFDGNSMTTNPSTITTNATGGFSATFNTTSDSVGSKPVTATDGTNTPTANFNVTPSITLSPTNGPINSSVYVIGNGFATYQPVAITFAGSTVTTIPASFNTNTLGFFNVSFSVPAGQTVGGKTVSATDANANAANATFTVTPSTSISPLIGNVGSTVTVSGSGFAANSAITAKFAGSSVTLSGTTSTNSVGAFTGANFTVPTYASTWATGSAQTVTITDASSDSAGNSYTVNTLTQTITVNLSNSAPSATVTVNGGYPPSLLAADSAPHTVTLFAGAPFNLSFTNSGNTRDGFNVSNAFSSSSSSFNASINSVTVTAYEQVQNTFSTTFSGGSVGSGDSLLLTGTYLGTSSSTITTLNTANSWKATVWTDYNAVVNFPPTTTLNNTTQRWAINGAYLTGALMTGGNTYSQTYYNQYSETLSFSVNTGSGNGSPTFAANQFGSSAPQTLTTTATSYWFDAGATWTVSSTLSGAPNYFRWAVQSATGILSSSSAWTNVFPYYYQVNNTFSASFSDGNPGTGDTLTLTGQLFGNPGVTILNLNVAGVTSNSSSAWSDYNYAVTFSSNTAKSSSSERWAISSAYTTSTLTTGGNNYSPNAHYYNQYSVTPYYTLSDSSSPTMTNIVGFTQFGNSATTTPTQGTSSGTPVWIDATSVVTYTSPIAGGSGERWQVASGDTTKNTAIASVSSSGSATVTYYHQYLMTLSYSVSSGSGYSAPSFSANAFGVSSPQTLTNAATGYWFDASASWNVNNPLGGSSGSQRWYTNQAVSGTVSASTIAFTYYNQYQLTMATNFGSTSPAAGTSWVNAGSSVTIFAVSPSVVSGEQYVWNGWSGSGTGYYSGAGNNSALVTMSAPITETASWTHQYQLTMATNFGSTSPAAGTSWVNAGSSVTIFAVSPSVVSGEQYVWNGWSGSGTGYYSGAGNNSALVTMSAPITETASWTHQYQLTVSSSYGSPTGQGWYNAGSSASFAVTTPASGGTGTQYAFTTWTGSGTGSYNGASSSQSVTMNNPISETASWQTQYYLTVTSAEGTTSGQGWYNSGTAAYAGVSSGTVSGGTGTQYLFTSWSGAASGSNYAQSNAITMSGPLTATANWQTQYQVTFVSSPIAGGSTAPSGNSVWENAGTLSISATANSKYHFSSWSATAGTITSATSASTTATISATCTITATFNLNLGIDASNTASYTSGSALTVSLTTTNSSDLLYLSVVSRSNYVASISGGGLTWACRQTAGNTISFGSTYYMSTWYAVWSSSGTITITVTMSATSSSVSLVAYGVSGVNTTSTFAFDGAYNSTTGTGSSATVLESTSNANDMIIGAIGISSTTSSPPALTVGTGGSGFTLVNTATQASGNYRLETSDEYQTVSATQSKLAVGYTWTGSYNWGIVTDAIRQIS